MTHVPPYNTGNLRLYGYSYKSRSLTIHRVFVIFQVTVLPALILAQVEPKYAISRIIFYREASSKMYGQFAFASSLVVAELPYSILCAICFFLPIYYMPGFQTAPNRAGYQFLMVLITELFSVTLGQAVAAITPSPCKLLTSENLSISNTYSSHQRPPQSFLDHHVCPFLRRHHPVPSNPRILARLALPTRSLHAPHWRHGCHRAARPACCLRCI